LLEEVSESICHCHVLTVPMFFKLGSGFMPQLDEGTLLYMPTTLPGMSVTEASR
jgi:Cu(I)/Ag(I) efflux system membrane protein CusA/SilA